MASAVWKGHLGFGLVSIPVRLYRAARRERVRLHYLAPQPKTPPGPDLLPVPTAASHGQPSEDLEPDEAAPEPPVSRITQTFQTPEPSGPVSRSDLLRGHEIAPDQYVTFTQDELRALRPETSAEMQIVRSVRLEEIDPVYFETSYYVIPDRVGERAYCLLYLALKETRYVALATFAMHGREHVVVIRPGAKGLLGHTMYYEEEVRAESEFETKISDTAPKELQLAKAFVETIAGPFAPEEFKDSHRQRLEALISAKLARSETASSAPVAKPPAATVDIMEALRKSIETKRKPRESDAPVPRREPASATGSKARPRKRRA